MAALDVVIVLFQVYFRLNTLRMCKSLINAVNSPQFLPFDAFPASQRVTYRFFVGRLAIFDEDYVRSALHLRNLHVDTYACFALVGVVKLSPPAQLSATLCSSWQTCCMTLSASCVPGKQQRLALGHPVLAAE